VRELLGRGTGVPAILVHAHRCPECGSGSLVNRRGRFAAPGPLLASAECDAEVQHENHRRRSTIPPRIRREVLERDGDTCQAPGCHHRVFLGIHHRIPVADGGRSVPENLVTLCSRCYRRLHEREAEMCRDERNPLP
jgi:5-methylcytosine-specific restriction endonuclease McrA